MKYLLPVLALAGMASLAQAQSEPGTVPMPADPGTSSSPSSITAAPPKTAPTEPFVAEEHTGNGRLGMRIGFLKNGMPYIAALTQGGPAMDFGFRVGDIILRIGKNDPLSLTQEQVRLSLHGEPGSSIELTVMRNDETHPHVIAVKRRELPADSLDTITPLTPAQYYRPNPREVPTGNY